MGFVRRSFLSSICPIMRATTLLPGLSTPYGWALMSSFNLSFAMVDGLASLTYCDASTDRAHLAPVV
jgi:hypothetical protein